jgi:hypothetical protein
MGWSTNLALVMLLASLVGLAKQVLFVSYAKWLRERHNVTDAEKRTAMLMRSASFLGDRPARLSRGERSDVDTNFKRRLPPAA